MKNSKKELGDPVEETGRNCVHWGVGRDVAPWRGRAWEQQCWQWLNRITAKWGERLWSSAGSPALFRQDRFKWEDSGAWLRLGHSSWSRIIPFSWFGMIRPNCPLVFFPKIKQSLLEGEWDGHPGLQEQGVWSAPLCSDYIGSSVRRRGFKTGSVRPGFPLHLGS